jgi:hypothetical protein
LLTPAQVIVAQAEEPGAKETPGMSEAPPVKVSGG